MSGAALRWGRRIPVRAPALSLAAALCAIVAGVGGLGHLAAAVPEGGVEFQDGNGNAVESFSPDGVATFYVRDPALGTTGTSTATWTEIESQVPAGTWWSLATGAPHPGAYALSPASAYETAAPAGSPLSSVPSAEVNGVTTLVADFRPLTGEFKLLNDVNASSTLRIDFGFDVVDSYQASAQRAGVRSTSDAVGEWVSITEVLSETVETASPVSGLFRGAVTLSADVAALAAGDGAVWVQDGDQVSVSYYGSGGAVLDTHAATVELPPPGPTPTPVPTAQPQPPPAPVPAAGWLSLGVMAGVTAFVLARRLRGA